MLEDVEASMRVAPLNHAVTEQYLQELWLLAAGGFEAATEQRRLRLIELWKEMHPQAEEDASELLAMKQRALRSGFTAHQGYYELPGVLWFSDWEREAAQLAAEVLPDDEPPGTAGPG